MSRNCGHDKTISSILEWSPVAAGTFLIVFGMKGAKIQVDLYIGETDELADS